MLKYTFMRMPHFYEKYRKTNKEILILHNVINLRKRTIPDTFTPLHGIKASGVVMDPLLIFDAVLLYLSCGMSSCAIILLFNKPFYVCLNIFPQADPLSGGNDGLVLSEPDFC